MNNGWFGNLSHLNFNPELTRELGKLITDQREIWPMKWMCAPKSSVQTNKKLKRCVLIVNERTLHRRPNDSKLNNYTTLYNHHQWVKPIQHSQL